MLVRESGQVRPPEGAAEESAAKPDDGAAADTSSDKPDGEEKPRPPRVVAPVKSTAAVLALLSPRASAALDRALRYERTIYEAAVVVHDRRCVEHLGSARCAARGGRAPR